MRTETLAIDFGTSNSAAAICEQGMVRPIPLEGSSPTLPTAVFFPADKSPMQIGQAARDAMIAGEPGRYMRALKSVLGLPLLGEARPIGGKVRTIADIIAEFLSEVRKRAEAETGLHLPHALAGRPVHFHTGEPEKDARAEADLRACYLAAGFESVTFLAEPEAAAIASSRASAGDRLGLICDIGGGTSDFSVFRQQGHAMQILANYGIRLGGTDFDHALSMAHAMPALGLGSQLRRDMGEGLTPVPVAPYADLSTWAKIPFLYAPETRRMAKDMLRLAVEREKMQRFVTVLEHELGHDLAFAVEQGKIDANACTSGSTGTDKGANLSANTAAIAMDFIERGLAEPLPPGALDHTLAPFAERLREAASHTLHLAQVEPRAIDRIVLVGGSSLMRLVTEQAANLCPKAELHHHNAFTAVVDGLALATER